MTWAAGRYASLPAWFASSVRVPAAWKLTTPTLEIAHTDALDPSTVIEAASPDDAKLTDCAARATVNDCWTWAAGGHPRGSPASWIRSNPWEELRL